MPKVLLMPSKYVWQRVISEQLRESDNSFFLMVFIFCMDKAISKNCDYGHALVSGVQQLRGADSPRPACAACSDPATSPVARSRLLHCTPPAGSRCKGNSGELGEAR